MECREGLTRPECAVAILLVGAACVALHYAYFFHIGPAHIWPDSVDMWEVVMDEYPDGGIECHAVVTERMLRMSDVLYTGPYAMGDFGNHASHGRDDELAAGMVLDSDWRPPECGG